MFNLINVNGNLMACYGLNITLLYYSDSVLQWHAYVITKPDGKINICIGYNKLIG